jgi:hypothetical protein
MAEIAFFMTRRDTEQFVGFLIREFGARFVVDGRPTPELELCATWKCFERLLSQEPHRVRSFVHSFSRHVGTAIRSASRKSTQMMVGTISGSISVAEDLHSIS